MLHQIITTKDNSHTIYLPHLNEHYHSIHGAIQESQHVFIKNGLEYFINKFLKTDSKPTLSFGEGQGEVLKTEFLEMPIKLNLNILEIGFGTGLNALLTLLKVSEYPQIHINYSSIEAYPLHDEIIQQLNYNTILNEESVDSKRFPSPLGAFNEIHSAVWNAPIEITNKFTLHKIHQTLQQTNLI